MAGTEAHRIQKPPIPPRRPPRPPGRATRPPRQAPINRRKRFSEAPSVAPYVPPFRQRRLALAQLSEPEPGSDASQRTAWLDLTKAVHGAVNRVSTDTVAESAKALLRVNVVRARGLLCKTMLRAQLGSPGLAPILASLVAVINSRVPPVAALLVARLVAQLKEGYTSEDRSMCFATARFVACLYNQHVVSELLVLEFLTACLMDPSDGSVELAATTLAECAPFLADRSPKACEVVFQRLREVLHNGDLGRRAQVMVENLMARRRRKFAGEDTLDPRLDLLEEEDMITHFASLDDEQEDLDSECNGFQFDPEFLRNEQLYDEIKKDILGKEYDPAALDDSGRGAVSEVQGGDSQNVGTGESNNAEGQGNGGDGAKLRDMTDADLVDFRRAVYLTIHSGLTYEEWAHKLLKLMKKHGKKEKELCAMIIECCSEEKTYLRGYGLLGQRFCLLDKVYVIHFEKAFAMHYATIHRFDTRKIRHIACFYASLLASDALPWDVFQVVLLVEKETTASSRIFLKNLFQEMYKTMGTTSFKEHFKVPSLQEALSGVFPSDSAENATFSINFFAKIGLGFLTEDLRENLKSLPKDANQDAEGSESSSLSSSSSSLSSSSLSPSVGSKRTNDEVVADRPQKRRRSLEQTAFVDSSEPERRDEHAAKRDVSPPTHRESSVGQRVIAERRPADDRDSRVDDRAESPIARDMHNADRTYERSRQDYYTSSEDESKRAYADRRRYSQEVSRREDGMKRRRQEYSDLSEDESVEPSPRRHRRYDDAHRSSRRHGRGRETSRRSISPSRRYYSDNSYSPDRYRKRRSSRSSRRKRYRSSRGSRYVDYESDY